MQSENLSYSIIDRYDVNFFEKLFSFNDVKKFYVLRNDHAQDISLFVDYLVSTHNNGTSLNFTVSLNNGTPIGIVGGELQRDFDGIVAWNVSYAILPEYWNKGYATEALIAFTNEIKQYSIPKAFLDISTLNVNSEKVAQKTGFIQNSEVAHMDPEHEELDMLFHWEKKLHSQRDFYFSQGISAFRQKQYRDAEQLFMRALGEEYEGSPNTDALCYSNMGMACSSYGNYEKAFQCLRKAQSLGLSNPSIERELLWLKTNKGLV